MLLYQTQKCSIKHRPDTCSKYLRLAKLQKKGDCEIFWDDTTADDGHEIFMIELHESEGIQNWICQN